MFYLLYAIHRTYYNYDYFIHITCYVYNISYLYIILNVYLFKNE